MSVQITQQELQEIYDLEQDVGPKQKRIDELKSNVKALLISKMPVEFGRFDVVLIKRPGRHVPWRQAVVDYIGLDFAEKFKMRFPVFMRFEVKVEEHAVLPLWRNGGEAGIDADPNA
jgi:hypothetical protein